MVSLQPQSQRTESQSSFGGTSTSTTLPSPLLDSTQSPGESTVRSLHTQQSANLRQELCVLSKIGLPLAFSSAAKILQDMSNAVMLGRFNTSALAAVSVSMIWTSITDIMFLSGLGQLSTLCAQAYGAGNQRLVGIWLQIFLVFILIASVPVLALRWCTAPILQALGLPVDLSHLAGAYTVWSQGAFVCDMVYFAVKEYYAAQLIVYPDAVVDAVFIFVNCGMVYLFVFVLDFGQDGVIGAGIATTVTRFCRTVVYIMYCYMKGFHLETWHGWSWKEVFVWDRWRTLLMLVVPAGIGGLAEELQFEVCALLAGRMGKVQSASLNLCLNLIFLSFLFAMSMGEATGIRMAQFLGDSNIQAARYTSSVGIASIWVGSMLCGALLAAMMGPFAQLASHDPDVHEQLHRVRWSAAVIIALLGGFLPLANILTKQGRACILGFIVPVCCWCVGFPVTWFLSQTEYLVGIFQGLLVGYGLATTGLLLAYICSDWPAIVIQARDAAEVSSVSQEELSSVA